MAIGFDAHTNGINAFDLSVGVSSPQTFSHTTGSGSNRLLEVDVQMRGGTGGVVTGITYNGVAMTQVGTEAISATAHTCKFFLENPPSGTYTVSIAHNMTGGSHMVATARSLDGVDQTSPLNASNKAAASDTGPMSTAVTTTVDDCWVTDSCAMRTSSSDAATMTAVTNRVERGNSLTTANGMRGLTSTLGPAGAAGSKTMEWTKSLNHDWAIIVAAWTPASAGTQTLTPSLFSNSQSFHAPTVSPGAVSLAPSLLTNTQSFYAPTVTSGFTLAPPLFTGTQTFYAPTVAPGAVTLTPGVFTNTQTFHAPTVSGGAAVVAPPLLSNAQVFHAPTVSALNTLAPALVTNSQSFFAPTVAGANTLVPSLLASTAVIYAPTVTASATLSPSLLTNAQTFYGATVLAASSATLSPPVLVNSQAFYAPIVSLGSWTTSPTSAPSGWTVTPTSAPAALVVANDPNPSAWAVGE